MAKLFPPAQQVKENLYERRKGEEVLQEQGGQLMWKDAQRKTGELCRNGKGSVLTSRCAWTVPAGGLCSQTVWLQIRFLRFLAVDFGQTTLLAGLCGGVNEKHVCKVLSGCMEYRKFSINVNSY